jgi:hypothetical protein
MTRIKVFIVDHWAAIRQAMREILGKARTWGKRCPVDGNMALIIDPGQLARYGEYRETQLFNQGFFAGETDVGAESIQRRERI